MIDLAEFWFKIILPAIGLFMIAVGINCINRAFNGGAP